MEAPRVLFSDTSKAVLLAQSPRKATVQELGERAAQNFNNFLTASTPEERQKAREAFIGVMQENALTRGFYNSFKAARKNHPFVDAVWVSGAASTEVFPDAEPAVAYGKFCDSIDAVRNADANAIGNFLRSGFPPDFISNVLAVELLNINNMGLVARDPFGLKPDSKTINLVISEGAAKTIFLKLLESNAFSSFVSINHPDAISFGENGLEVANLSKAITAIQEFINLRANSDTQLASQISEFKRSVGISGSSQIEANGEFNIETLGAIIAYNTLERGANVDMSLLKTEKPAPRPPPAGAGKRDAGVVEKPKVDPNSPLTEEERNPVFNPKDFQ